MDSREGPFVYSQAEMDEALAKQREACADAVYRLTGDAEARDACLNARVEKSDE